MAQKPTPEEQLLKLIEGGETGGRPTPAAGKPQKESSASKPLSGMRKFPGFLDYFKGNFLSKQPRLNMTAVMDTRNINRGLIGLVAVSVLYLIIDLIFFRPGDTRFLSQVSTSDAVYPITSGALGATATDISVYKETLRKRNPFLAPQADQGAAAAADSGTSALPSAQGPLNEMLAGYKLVGISVGDQPLAMIEEISTGRTFFLRKGQEFKDMKVQDVSREKVTVTYEGQEADLF
jgi:hypothetical protein